jgi:protein-tyrosine phosphatase
VKTSILVVCLGNSCRSPLSEGILKSKLSPEKYHIDLAGTASYHIGIAPDPRSIQVASENNIDISLQRTRALKKEDFHVFDKIFVMDQNNYNYVIDLSRAEEEKNKVKLILNKSELPDPYCGDSTSFEMIFNLPDEACDKIYFQLENDKF